MNDESENYLSLESDLQAMRSQERKGLRRIEKWYSTPEDERENETDLEIPPHVALKKRSSAYLDMAISYQKKTPENLGEDASATEIHDILLAVGTEALLKAILLKEEPDVFIEKYVHRYEHRFETISLDKSSQKLHQYLPDDLDDKQRKRISLGLEAISIHRNNEVHFGYHRLIMPKLYRQIYRVLAYLHAQFFDPESAIVKRLLERSENLETTGGLTYEPISFEVLQSVDRGNG